MVIIDYQIITQRYPGRTTEPPTPDFGIASETELRYDLLLGDFVLLVNEVDFSTHVGWVPILDFMASLCQICENIKNGEKCQSYEFTESDAHVDFVADDELNVRIAASYIPDTALVPIRELANATIALKTRLMADLSSRYPTLLQNYAFKKLVNTCRLSDG